MNAGNRFTPPPAEVIAANVGAALAEDIGPGDATASLLEDAADSAYLLCKEDCVVAGRPWFDAVHRALDRDDGALGNVVALLATPVDAHVGIKRAVDGIEPRPAGDDAVFLA